MKVIPLEDRVLIKTAELEEKTKSGLFIPQTAQEKTQVGVVTAVGSDKEAIKVKVGQKIMYDKYHNLLFINPGAAGLYGIHTRLTMLRFEIEGEEVKNMDIYDIPKQTPVR
jgi:chaperonin GroES